MRLFKDRRLDDRAWRMLFALVANRTLAPSWKLAAAGWVNDDVLVDRLERTRDEACYRAMDWLLEVTHALEQEVFHQVANLLNLGLTCCSSTPPESAFTVVDDDHRSAPARRQLRLGSCPHGWAPDAAKFGARTTGAPLSAARWSARSTRFPVPARALSDLTSERRLGRTTASAVGSPSSSALVISRTEH